MQVCNPRPAFLVLALGTLWIAIAPAPARAQAKVPVKLTVTVGSRTETLRGTGECGHEPRAFLDGAEASLWMASYNQGGRHVALSYWRMGGGAGTDQFTLFVTSGSASHQISTVKSGEPLGTGQLSFQPTAQGGRFQVKGKDQDGAALSASIECARFGRIIAEGGETPATEAGRQP